MNIPLIKAVADASDSLQKTTTWGKVWQLGSICAFVGVSIYLVQKIDMLSENLNDVKVSVNHILESNKTSASQLKDYADKVAKEAENNAVSRIMHITTDEVVEGLNKSKLSYDDQVEAWINATPPWTKNLTALATSCNLDSVYLVEKVSETVKVSICKKAYVYKSKG